MENNNEDFISEYVQSVVKNINVASGVTMDFNIYAGDSNSNNNRIKITDWLSKKHK